MDCAIFLYGLNKVANHQGQAKMNFKGYNL